jgi:arylsulfatase A-like enzyme
MSKTDEDGSRRRIRPVADGNILAPPAAAIVRVALAAGLATGLVEVALLGVARFGLGRFTHLNPQVVWMAPVSYALVFALLTGVILAVGFKAPRIAVLRTIAFVCALCVAAGILFLWKRLHESAALILALGVAVQVSRLAPRYASVWVRAARRTALPLAALVLLLFLSLNGRWIWLERRALAALPAAADGRPNVLLIIWDTVRGASLSLYGYERETTPNLARLAERALVFDYAYSTAPWTTPSHASMFTGLEAADLSTDWATSLSRDPRTLAEVLAENGYRTGGFTANTYATGRESGLHRGFSHYADFLMFSPGELLRSTALLRSVVNRERWWNRLGIGHPLGYKSAAVVERQFLDWLSRESDRPFFAFINVWDAHAPYLPPPPFDTLFGPRLPGRDPQMPAGRTFTPRELRAEIDAYDGAIAELDQRFARLLEELDRRGVLDNTLVILTSDHGEEFGEHGVFTHGHTLYDRALRVPLVVFDPRRSEPGQRVSQFVSLRDLPATVLDAVGVAAGHGIPGTSLLRHSVAATGSADAAEAPVDTILAGVNHAPGNPPEYPVSLGDLRSVIVDPLKLIVNSAGLVELYDLRADSVEMQNLAENEEYADERAALERVLDRLAPPRARSRN